MTNEIQNKYMKFNRDQLDLIQSMTFNYKLLSNADGKKRQYSIGTGGILENSKDIWAYEDKDKKRLHYPSVTIGKLKDGYHVITRDDE